jgi:DNA helicase-2/ATP-dependent DNA helicase PcrA
MEVQILNLTLDLNKKQKEAVLHDKGPSLVVAGAGSGKTRVITYRIARLIKEGIFPSEILTVTFTNKAASEMEERVKKIVDCDISSMWIGTFHSMCLKILSENLDKIGYKPNYLIYDTDDSVKIVNDIINSMGLDDKVYEDKKVFFKITEAKRNLISFANYLQKLGREPFERDRYIQKIYKEYYKRLKKNNAFDFTDLITKTIYLFRKYPEVLEHYQNKFKYIQCDEYQDTNHSQYIILKMLADKHKNIMAVGDSDQCQPPNTEVLTTKGYKKIKDLEPGVDKVPSYDRRGSYVIGLSDDYGYEIKKGMRNYKGKMYEIETEDGKISKSTYNHKWLVKWTNKSTNYNVVYLMQKDDKFRVGWCQLFKANGGFHLGVRSRIEKADKAWILKVVKTKKEAFAWESIIASRYGIPQLTFQETNDGATNGYLTKEVISSVYENLSYERLYKNAKKCLKDHDREIEFPFFDVENVYQRRGGKSIIKIKACNFIPELMKVPVHIKGKKTEWKKIKKLRIYDYDGPVYSLNVDKYHKYIADGIVTCNSIYGFRGSDIQNIIDFEKEYKNVNIIKLERNYRSTSNIIEASNEVVKNNKKRREKVAFTKAKPGFPIVIAETFDSYKEADFIVNTIKTLTDANNYDYKDITLLYRSNYQSQNFETAFVNAGIPYTVVKGTGFFDRKEIKDLLAFIRLTANVEDSPSLNRIINLESNGIGPVTVAKMLEHSYNTMLPLIDVVKSPSSVNGIGKVKGEAVLKMFDEYLKPIMKIREEDLGLQETILKIYEDVHFEDILLQDEETYENRMKNVEAFFDFVNNYVEKNSNDDSLVDFLQNVKLISDQDQLDQDSDKVKLMTVHAAKGLEFPVVFMVGMEEETFPHKFSLEEPDGEEEERRLCYVAMTRAEERLFLTYCKRRFQFYQFVDKKPSRFIDEIPMKYSKFMIYSDKSKKAI